MILYHGSIIEVKQPQVIKTELGRDFGFGFYTTDIKGQAIRWAKRKAKIEKHRIKNNCKAILNIYEWDDEFCKDKLYIKNFEGPSMEWLEFVIKCRSDIKFTHGYDIAIGNIANDNVGETVSYVIQGVMRKEDAVERLKFETINNQISFHTQEALTYLKFVKSVEV